MTLEPGIYKATVRGVPNVTVMVGGEGHGWTNAPVGTSFRNAGIAHIPDQITDARPLILLDLVGLDESAVQFVVGVLRQPHHSWTNDVADQIEAQIKPVKPVEPTDVGWVVTASQVGECDGSERMWTRFRPGRGDCWIDTLGHIRSWSDLEDVTV